MQFAAGFVAGYMSAQMNLLSIAVGFIGSMVVCHTFPRVHARAEVWCRQARDRLATISDAGGM